MPEDSLKRSRENEEEEFEEEVPSPKKKKRTYLVDIPTRNHYHVSWMHADCVVAIVASQKHGYVVSASADGVVKFWKRLSVQVVNNETATDNQDTAAKKQEESSSAHACLEFVKSFTAHAGKVNALAMDSGGDTCCSVGSDGWLKFYDVCTFDVSTMLHTRKELGTSCCSIESIQAWAVSAFSSGDIYIFSTTSLLHTVTLHGTSVVTNLVAVPTRSCVLSTDQRGIVEVWSTEPDTVSPGDDNEGDADEQVKVKVGGACNKSNGVLYTSKMDTDLYTLVRKKTHCIAAAVTSTHYALYCEDNRIRLFDHVHGKLVVTFDERLKVYDKIYESTFGLDNIEYGRRAALEREIAQDSSLFSAGLANDHRSTQRLSIQFDPSGKYLLLPTMVGIKVIDWERRKLVAIAGKADASQMRFISVCLATGDPKVNRQMQLARSMGSVQTSMAIEADKDKLKLSDSLLLTTSFNQRRLYVFSHVDPVEDAESEEEDALGNRDVFNEAPTAEDQLYTANASGPRGASSKLATKAILRTTMGDIHLQLFASQTPKTVENFVGHSKSGYYDNVIFHRVIKGFMIQTGDPNGDGTGGESIWGGEFEDEFVPGLRHDRPFTLSMANCGPSTNGSQFFITTVPCSWLDNKHTVFGRVVKGMDICTLIENVKTDDMDKPLDEIRIINVDLVD